MDFFKHDVSKLEEEYTCKAIREGHITTGVYVQKFREALMEKFRLAPLAFTNSGTSALHLSLLASGVGPGDEVITTPYVGVWTSNPILMVGATPVYADIDRDTYNLDPRSVAKRLTSKTKAVIPVATFGNPVDLRALRYVLPKEVKIISDDIEALGSTLNGVYVGEDPGSDVSVGGFWVSKQVTAGGMGGMVVSQDSEFLDKFTRLTRHGHGLVGNMWEQSFGYNMWLPDPMAAFGLAQVERYEEKQLRLRKVRSKLDQYFVRSQVPVPGSTASEFIYVIELPEGVSKRSYADKMAVLGVPTRPYFNSLLDVPHLKKYAPEDGCPVATHVSARTMAVPYHHLMTEEDVELVFEAHESTLRSLVPSNSLCN